MKKSFLMKTPTIHDSDIRQLIGKYPVNVDDDNDHSNTREHFKKVAANEVSCEPCHTESSVIKQKLEGITRVINQTLIQSKADAQEQIAKQVLNNFRNEELQRISDTFREIDFAEPNTFSTMYYYKANDADEKLQIQLDVTDEYKDGKLDPNKFAGNVKK